MRINTEAQVPLQPARERQPIVLEEIKERATKIQEKPPVAPKPAGPVGTNLDTQA